MIGELANPHCAAGTRKKPESSTPNCCFQSGLPFMSRACRPSEPRKATMCVPSVASVELAWVALVWRLIAGTPRCSSRSQRTLPEALSRQITFQTRAVVSSTGVMLP